MSRTRTTAGRKARRKNPTPPPDGPWRIPDVLWEHIKPLLPRPLGCHNPATEPRKVVNVIFFLLRTGCRWNALNATGLCSGSSAHRWFQVRTKAGVFKKLWKLSLTEYDELKGIDRANCGVKRGPLCEGRGAAIGLAVVERTHSWMSRSRRLLTRWEKKPENDLGFPHLACALITYRAAGLLR